MQAGIRTELTEAANGRSQEYGAVLPNEETRQAMENVLQGKNLSPTFGSVAELMEDLKR